MNLPIECAPCILKWACERTATSANEEQRYELMRTILGVLSREHTASGNIGLIAIRVLDAVREFVMASSAYFNEIKVKANKAVEALLPASRTFINKGETPQERFERACCMASVGNVTPIGAPTGDLKFPDAENILRGEGSLPTVMGDVYGAAVNASQILYLADNAGEIGFDSLLIEALKAMGSRVTLVVKEDFLFEDVTISDAAYFRLDKLVDEILTVRDAFVPGESTSTLEDAYRQSDFVIAKGGFNFETLGGKVSGKPTIYILQAKCGPIAEMNNTDMGRFIVKFENT